MKYIVFILIASFSGFVACSQNNARDSVIQLKIFPDDGLLLNQGWTFYPGDDSACLNYDYEGKNGVAINPALLLDQLPVVKESGFGWFRLKLQVDSSLRNKTIGVTLSMMGAVEIFLNGEPVINFGRASGNYEEERTEAIFQTAFNLKLGENDKQILAVRYSYHPDNIYLKAGVIPYCLSLRLNPANQNIDIFSKIVKLTYLFFGIVVTVDLAAALLTLIFFFYYPWRKEYLYYGLYFACQFLGMLMQLDLLRVGEEENVSVNKFVLLVFGANVLIITASVFYLNGMYKLLNYRRTKFYYFLFVYALLTIVAVPFLPPWAGIFLFLFLPLTCVEILPIYYKAARRKFRGAWILFLSILICTFTMGLLINAVVSNAFVTILTGIAVLIPALGLLIFLALDFAGISRSLQKRVKEVEELSIKTVEQERQKQEIITGQKEKLEEEVQLRTQQLSKSLDHLKTTQAQLIQSEKMASLGELTAGIAHEIQNPLNFVNNFSEINNELIAEMKEEIRKGDYGQADHIANDISQNLEKINLHGKRADAIVKSMLQHSTTSRSVKEPADLNALCDECLRLAYHGLRAKNKDFNAGLETNFDKQIGKVNIISRDISRVLLNLYNNAFYAVWQKKISSDGTYEPAVLVSTRLIHENGISETWTKAIEISVRDNGNGISSKIKDKIFQPFFTTKPTGQGTGLGLSLSYDIVKAHGGDFKVESEEGNGSVFRIFLPIENHKLE